MYMPLSKWLRSTNAGQHMVVLRLSYLSASQLLIRFFFFQAEDGIRDLIVTGVQTCALPICGEPSIPFERRFRAPRRDERLHILVDLERRHARLHEPAQVRDDVGQHVAGRAHETELAGGLQLDHARAPAAAPRTAPRIVSIGPSPGTE